MNALMFRVRQLPSARRVAMAVLAVASTLFLASCEDPGSQPAPEKARLRLLHMAFDAPNVDLRVDGALIASSVAALQSSGYQLVDAGTRRIVIAPAGGSAELLVATEALEEGRDYTIYAFSPAAAFTASLREDQRLVPLGKSGIRLVNATTDGGQLELRLASGSTALAGPVSQASVSTQRQIDAGTVSFGIYRDGSLIADYDPVTLSEKTSYTIVVHGTVNASDAVPMGVRMFTDNGSGDAYVDLVATSFDARLMTVNAIVGASSLNATLDGTSFSTMGFAQHTPYAGVTPGNRRLAFLTSGSTIIDREIDLQSRKAYSVFATGTLVPADVAPLVLQDVTMPNTTQALVRFVNLSPDMGKVDVLTPLGTSDYEIPYMQGIGYREVSQSATTGSAFLALPPSPVGAPYLFKFRKSGTSTVVFELDGVVLEAGKIYTLWVGGRTSNDSQEAYLIPHGS